MKILVLGSGGREHALLHWLSKDENIAKLWVSPGNGGTGDLAESVEFSDNSFEEIFSFCKQRAIDFLIPGPEQPLVDGIADYFSSKQSETFVLGPHKSGAMLEASKSFSKEFMRQYKVPCAKSRSFDAHNLDEAYAFLEGMTAPYVLKADGLAAGKGVLIIEDLNKAKNALQDMLINQRFGLASERVLIEAFLLGKEFSVFIFTNGKDYLLLPEAKDYKRIGEGDTGLNTGGMGSISPVPFFDNKLKEKVEKQIIEPTLKGIQDRKLNYCGFLFFGMIEVDGEPYVIEYNARMGDPETQSVLPRIVTPASNMLLAVKNGTLNALNLEISPTSCCSVVAVSGGYPEAYKKFKEITINEVDEIIFHAGTKIVDNKLLTNGGRVLSSTSFGLNQEDALKKCYQQLKQVSFEDCYYRKDIGKDIL